MTLTQYEYIWQVNYVSKDDGHNLTDSYWTDLNKAEKRAIELGGRVNQTTLFKDGERWYKVQYKEADVDPINREEAMKKLNHKEKGALGLL